MDLARAGLIVGVLALAVAVPVPASSGPASGSAVPTAYTALADDPSPTATPSSVQPAAPGDVRTGGSAPAAGRAKPGWPVWAVLALVVLLATGGVRLWRSTR